MIKESKTRVQVTIELDEPIKRGDSEIKTLTIRKPKSGALRGVSLIDLAQLHFNALQVVLPRITDPTLTAKDVADMDPADLVTIGSEVAYFLANKADRLAASPTT